MKNLLLTFAAFFIMLPFANAQLNDYKYIIIPKTLGKFKEQNKHQTSTFLKYLFTDAGYTAIYDDYLPEDLKTNVCSALHADLEDNSSLFVTKVNIVLKDCHGKFIFTSKEGKSREKDFKVSYKNAIKNAFTSFKTLNYKYTPKEVEGEKKSVQKIVQNDKKAINVEQQEATVENQSYKNIEPVPSNLKKGNKKDNLEVLYAQPTSNGFQLVDSTPKIQYKLIETSVENVFIATYGEQSGVVLKNADKWFFEYNKDGKKILRELYIKF